MDRREFCKLGVGTAAALGLGRLAIGAEETAAPAKCDPDRLAAAAVKHFLPGKRTCGEAIMMAACEAMGIRSKLVPDVALGLSGGIGRQGDVCGVLCGAALMVGIAAGRKFPKYVKKRQVTWDVTAKLYKDFQAKFGCVECRKLCGLDLTKPEGMKALAAGVKKNKCGKVVDAAARMLAEALQQVEKTA